MAFDWDSIEVTATTKGYGGSSTEVYGGPKEKAVRRAQETAAWESMEITFESKQVRSAEEVLNDYNSKSNLDAVSKATASFSSSLDSMTNKAMSGINTGIAAVAGISAGYSALNGLFGNGGVKDIVSQSTAAISEIGKLDSINGFSGMLFGNGVSGGFNPAGLASTYTGDAAEVAAAAYVNLAPTVFTSGGSIQGETVDIYKGTINSPQNKIKSVLSDVMDVVSNALGTSLSSTLKNIAGKAGVTGNIVSNITDGNSAKSVLNRFKTDILSGVPLTKDGITKTLFESVGYDGKSLNFKDGISGLGESMLNDITKQIDGTTGLLTMYDGVKVIVNGDYDTAEGIFKILENVTGNKKLSSFMDLTSQFQILNTVTSSLMNLGADEWFDKIIESVTDDDKEKYIADNMSSAISSGDLDFIISSMKYVSGSWIRSNYPDAIKNIVSNYTPILKNDDQIGASEYAKLLKVLNYIDSKWDIVGIRHGVKVYNYNLFACFNSQSKLAVLAGGNREHIRSMIGCDNFADDYNIADELQIRYPYYPITQS